MRLMATWMTPPAFCVILPARRGCAMRQVTLRRQVEPAGFIWPRRTTFAVRIGRGLGVVRGLLSWGVDVQVGAD